MKLPRRTFLHLAAGASALPAVSRIVVAQSYPSRPVRVIVPYAPGGPTDILARLMAQKLSEHFGKQFYVENIGGAGGNVGKGQGAKAVPDGYTMLVAGTPMVINPTLYERVPFDPYKDFDPVTLAVTSPDMLSVNAVATGAVSQGPRRPHQSPSRQIQFCFPWDRDTGTSRRRIVPPVARPGPCAYTFQQCGLGNRLNGCGPHPDCLHHAAGGRAAGQGREAAPAGGGEQDARVLLITVLCCRGGRKWLTKCWQVV
jgi:hypothetical protein